MKKLKTALLIIFPLVVFFILADIYISSKWLTVSSFQISSNSLKESVRIVQLTDLHNAEFGTGNERLVEKVEEQNPDLILITGDLINSKDGADTSIAEDLIRNLSGLAPVYVSYGNQEYNIEKNSKTARSFAEIYSAAGAVVLDREWIDLEIKGQKLRIGGIYGYCLPEKYSQENKSQDESEYLKEFQDTDRYTILMCHLPVSWIGEKSAYDWDVDIVFTGHIHGGQIRLPFIGGLWAPDLGWFPGQVCGLYVTEEDKWQEVFDQLKNYKAKGSDNSYYSDARSYHETSVILSRGLGNTERIPRFNNIPEIVVTDLS